MSQITGIIPWRQVALEERDSAHRKLKTLPLYESLKAPASSLARSKIQLRFLLDERLMPIPKAKGPRQVPALLDALDIVKAGGNPAIDLDLVSVIILDAFEAKFPYMFLTNRSKAPEAHVQELYLHTEGLRKPMADLMGMDEGLATELVGSLPGGAASMGQLRRLYKSISRPSLGSTIDLAVALRLVRGISTILTCEEIADLRDLIASGLREADKLRSLRRRLDGERASPSNRGPSLRAYCALAYPRTLSAFDDLHSEWLSSRTEKGDAIPPQAEDEMPPAPLLEEMGDGRRYDRAALKDLYPNLYRKLIGPTFEESEARRLNKTIRRILRQGAPDGFIKEMLGDAPSMRADDLESAWDSCQGEGAGSPPSSRPRARREQMVGGASQGTASGRAPAYSTRDGFLSSISFDPSTERAIASLGVEPRDVVLALCKGFEFGRRGRCAVGGGHYRGAHIRNNIRRFLERDPPSRKKPSVQQLIGVLDSFDLIRRFGSSASTRTKDDAMSVNTSPSTQEGKAIISTLNAAFMELRGARQSRKP